MRTFDHREDNNGSKTSIRGPRVSLPQDKYLNGNVDIETPRIQNPFENLQQETFQQS